MKSASAILYASHSPSRGSQGIFIHANHCLWIRVEVKPGLSDIMALEKAKPRQGEILLNTIELPE